MRILIHGINYSPELTGIGKYTGEMAEWLAGRGHNVRVVTAPPYYPEWQIGKGYSSLIYKLETINGVGVVRCPLWVPRKLSGIKRILHLASFALSSFPVMISHLLWRPDVVIAIEPPVMCAPQALIAARLSGAKALLHIQDFEIDAAFELGMLPSGQIRKITESLERVLLRRFDMVSTISDRMVERLITKGVEKTRCLKFENWVDAELIHPLDRPSVYRKEIGVPDDAVVALYSGNLGEKQGLEVLLEAASLLADRSNIRFVICGNGATKDKLVAMAEGLKNITFIPLQPLDRLNELLNLADIHLLPQKADAADIVMPSKLSGMMASGRPVIATVPLSSQVARAVEGCGVIVPPLDTQGFVSSIIRLALSPNERELLGANARCYAEANWDREGILKKFESDLSTIIDKN